MKDNADIIFKFSVPIFILLGLAEVSSYYKQFNFPIIEYLSIAEILTAFLSNLYVYAALFMQFAVVFIIDNKHFRGSMTLVFIVSTLISIFAALAGDPRFHTASDILTVVTIIVVIGSLLLYISRTSVFNYFSSLEKIKSNLATAVIVFLVLLVISSFHGKFSASIVKNKHIYNGTSIQLKADTLISNDSSYFIGKTNSYVFFYDTKKQNVNIYPLTMIEKIVFKFNEPK